MTTRRSRFARYGGLLLGSALAGALLWSGAMPSNRLAGTELPARVTMTSETSELVSVNPAGDFIAAQPVSRSPRRDATGSFSIHNPAGSLVALRISTPSGSKDADQLASNLVHVAVEAGSRTVYSGAVAGLQTRGTEEFTIAKDGDVVVRVRAWLPGSTGLDHQARAIKVPLELQGRRVSG